mgnify:CR=1 FL=1
MSTATPAQPTHLDFYRGRPAFGTVNGHQDMTAVSRALQMLVQTLAASVALVGA